MTTLKINGQTRTLDADPDMPLLWALREELKLTGTKFGCGIAQCGACTVHIDGAPMRSCSVSVSMAEGSEVTTIDQCGYCQSGQIMSVLALLRDTPNPTDADIDIAMRGNICRCGAYGRIREAIKSAAKAMPQTIVPTEAVDVEGSDNG